MTVLHMISRGLTTSAMTVFVKNEVRVVTNERPDFESIVALVEGGGTEDEVLAAIDPGVKVQNYFQRVSERVTVTNGHLYVDGDEVNDGLANTILRYMDEGNDPTPLVNFLENVLANPNEHSRTQLYDWLSRYDFAITPEGHFLAYKGVYTHVGDDKYPYRSVNSGTATVDGQVYTGQIPNGVGALVEMPRGDVQHDPAVGCHTGLHAGTFAYASTFASGATLLVDINPRDVVSVPTDCNWQKIRTCRYKVVSVVTEPVENALYDDGEELDDDGEYYDDYDSSWYEAAEY